MGVSTMYSTDPNAVRFREARERLGLSPKEAAERMAVALGALRDIECIADELMIYSPAQIQKFCEVLAINPRDLLGIESTAAPITPTELVALIREHCRAHGMTIGQFEDASGWTLAHTMEQPAQFLHDYNMEAFREICGGLGVDWQRFVLSL